MFFLFPCNIVAQQKLQFSIEQFELNQLDGTATNSKYQKVDGSGNLYAIIKVRSTDGGEDLDGFSFNFNSLKSIVENHGDELWVYVQKNAKIVTISRDGYKTLKNIDLKQTLQAGKTYNMNIAYERAASINKKEFRMQMLQFVITPAIENTTILYKKKGADNFEILGKTDKDGVFAKSFKLGEYEYQIMADAYETSTGLIKLDNDTVFVEKVTLKPNFSNITLICDEDADIYINNERKAKGKWVGILTAGDYIIECKKESHNPTVQEIKVEANADKEIKLESPTPRTGLLSITSTPQGATIKIDGKDMGKTPNLFHDVLIGKRKIEITKQNYNPVEIEVEIKEGETTEKNVDLDNVINVNITSKPRSGAKIYIDGKYIGVTPFKVDVTSGKHLLELKMNKYKDYKETVTLNSKNPEYNAHLKRMHMKKDYFYFHGDVNVGAMSAYGGGMGLYVNNFNMQLDYLVADGIQCNVTRLYYNHTFDEYTYSNKSCYVCDNEYIGGRIGYGFFLGSRFRLTPQVGCGVMSSNVDSYQNYESHAVVGKIALRTEMAIWSWLGLSICPECSFAIKESDNFKFLSKNSEVKGLANGFNISGGLFIGF